MTDNTGINPALKAAPRQLIDANGKPESGNFAGPVHDINWRSFDFRALKRSPWTFGKTLAQKLFKRWQFVGVIDREFALGAAVAHVNYLGTGFVYLYERRSGKLTEFNIKRPLAIGTTFSESPENGVTRIEKGADFIEFENTRKGSRGAAIKISIADGIKAEFELSENSNGVSTACPQDDTGFHYTYKCAGQSARGFFELDGQRREFRNDALALFDWTASTPPRVTRWNWAAAVGCDSAGRIIGVNLSRGLVTSGYSQNSIWIDGRPFLLSDAQFDYNPQRILEDTWRVSTSDNKLELHFKAQSERREDINLGLVSSRFRQPFGEFSGLVRLPNETLELSLFGVCEEHLAKW